jgi:protein involved in polysaccharide export with SLBB domain
MRRIRPASMQGLMPDCRFAGRAWLLATVAACCLLGGCSQLSNPVAGGIPVNRLPPEVFGRSRETAISIPLTKLRQPPIEVYRLDVGDTLGIWAEGAIGTPGTQPPVTPPNPGSLLPPSLGFPIPVLEDGTILLPMINAVPVKGLTIPEVREKLRLAYTVSGSVGLFYTLKEWGFPELQADFPGRDLFGIGREILKPGSERILVDLQRPRLYHILVIRQDSGGVTVPGGAGVASGGELLASKRGTGFQLDLPAGENDVLNAAPTEIDCSAMQSYLDKGQIPPGWGGGERIRIPLRLHPDQPLPFDEEEILLRTGDVVYIENRDPDVYYTAGFLGSKQFILPRDYDLTVLDAIMLAGGVLFTGGSNSSSLSGSVVPSGIGQPSPSLVNILRRTPDGGQINIRVDLYKAINDPRERILIQAKDIILLQQTPGEALAQYLSEQVHFNLFSTLLQRRDITITGTANGP